MNDLGQLLVPGAIVGGPLIFGVFYVLRGIMRFQRDFTEEYADEIKALRGEILDLRAEVKECEAAKRQMIRIMHQHNLDVP